MSWTVARYNINVICWHTLHTSHQSPRHHAWIRNILKVSTKEVNFGFENTENLSVCSASLKKLCTAGRALGVQYQASEGIVMMFRIVYETLIRRQHSSERIWQIDIYYHSTLSNLENYGDGANWLKQTDGRTDNLMFGGLNSLISGWVQHIHLSMKSTKLKAIRSTLKTWMTLLDDNMRSYCQLTIMIENINERCMCCDNIP